MNYYTLASAVLGLSIAGGLGMPTLAAEAKKQSPAHEAGSAAAHAPNSPTGKARLRTMNAFAEAKKAFVARAPK